MITLDFTDETKGAIIPVGTYMYDTMADPIAVVIDEDNYDVEEVLDYLGFETEGRILPDPKQAFITVYDNDGTIACIIHLIDKGEQEILSSFQKSIEDNIYYNKNITTLDEIIKNIDAIFHAMYTTWLEYSVPLHVKIKPHLIEHMNNMIIKNAKLWNIIITHMDNETVIFKDNIHEDPNSDAGILIYKSIEGD